MSEAWKKVLEPYQGKPECLIPALQKIQEHLGFLPPEALEEVARSLKVPLSKVYGVATFYAQFRLNKVAEHLIQVCCGTACHVRGAPQLLEELKRHLRIGEDGLSPDGNVFVEEVRCVGACALGPVIVVNGGYWGRMTPAKVKDLIRTLQERKDAKA